MNRYRNRIRPINGLFDERGDIHGSFATTVPIDGFVCWWPRFPALPPPAQTSEENQKSRQGPNIIVEQESTQGEVGEFAIMNQIPSQHLQSGPSSRPEKRSVVGKK